MDAQGHLFRFAFDHPLGMCFARTGYASLPGLYLGDARPKRITHADAFPAFLHGGNCHPYLY